MVIQQERGTARGSAREVDAPRETQKRFFGEAVKSVQPGTYRHFTGELFTVLFTGLDTTTKQESVVYKSQTLHERIYIAPLQKFLGAVVVPGKHEVSRFERID